MVDYKFMKKFIKIASRLGAQRHLVAIRNGFVAIMPLIIAGSLAILLNNFPVFGNFNMVQLLNHIFGDGNWQIVGNSVWNGTFAILGILLSFSISYYLAKSYELDELSVGLISVASYIMLIPITNDGGFSFVWTGAQGLFVAIFLSIIITELFRILMKNDRLVIKMPEGVPGGVAKSFAALLPALIILILVGLFQTLVTTLTDTSVFELIFILIQEPLQGLGNTLPVAILVAFLNHFLWFFGLHGTNILAGVIEPIYLPPIESNVDFFASGMSAYDVPYIVTKPFFDVFVYMGGAGTSIALIIAVIIVVRQEKKHPYREVSKLAVPAGIFNINEPIIFGIPIVLNPIFFIPFIIGPVLLTITSYFALATGLVPKTVAFLPWTTPPFISGYLVTGGSWRGIILQMINLGISVLLYLPFVMAGVRALKIKSENNS